MRLLRNLTRFGQRLLQIHRLDDAHSSAARLRICRFEEVEPRTLMTASTPAIIVGGTEYEQAAGNDKQANVFVVTFQGGAADTQLTHLDINGSKAGGALTFNDAVFDTAAGGLGAYQFHPIHILSHDGFQVLNYGAADGSTLLSMDFSGFTAGMRLVFTVDVDQVIYVDPVTNAVEVDAVVEGAEFQRSHFTTTFTAPHYQDITIGAQYWDVYGDKVAAAEQQAGTPIDLPNDAYTNAVASASLVLADGPGSQLPQLQDVSSMTTAAVGVAPQVPLPITLSGKAYEDHNLNNQIDPGDQGVGGVPLALWQFDGSKFVDTGKSTTTDAQGNYRFTGLLPRQYQVVKVNPPGYFSVGATAGQVGGNTDGVVSSADVLSQITLQGGDDSVQNNFALALPAKISGFVYHDRNDDGHRDPGEEGIAGVTLSIVPVNVFGTPPAPIKVVTKADGSYSATGLNPGTWKVVEVDQPPGYLDGLASAGTAGGTAINPGDRIESISLGDSQSGEEYDFGKLLPNSISGRVVVTTYQDCMADPNPTSLGGVTIELLNSSNQVIATTKTDNQGNYQFGALPPGTYSVREVQPVGYIEGDSDVGSAGGTSVNPDLISTITLVSDIHGVHYDFCEHPYSSLSGVVHIDVDGNCDTNPNEPTLAGVAIQLLDGNGNVVGVTQTDANGAYTFGHLTPGQYSVRELQPAGYYFDDAHAGSVGGTASDNHDVTGIALPLATDALHYNFCVLPPGSLAGFVQIDVDGKCDTNPNEPKLSGVTIQLRDAQGNVLQTTTTDANGHYLFDNLAPGSYTIHELPPAGYYEEDAHAGSAGGTVVGLDTLASIALAGGVHGLNYNFCVLPPGSISGFVHNDVDGNCDTNPNEPTLAGVTVQLLDSQGVVLQSTTTDAQGRYAFTALPPATYLVRDLAPPGYLLEDAHAGSVGGVVVGKDTVSTIALNAGVDATHYDFCVQLPAAISGFVYYDQNNDGVFDQGDTGIGGVTVMLKGANGQPTGATAITDSTGYYHFDTLTPGTYGVGEAPPAGYLAGATNVGSAGGTAMGQMIVGAVLAAGTNAVHYDFGEVLPASITGRVQVPPNGDCNGQTNLPGLADVVINLLDSHGTLVATTKTDANGDYAFSGLRPGTYSVQEVQPAAYFVGDSDVGTAGGSAADANDITDITLGSGVAGAFYDFCVVPPAAISGTVFQDGPPIPLFGNQTVDVPKVRDGVLTPDDVRLSGVTLELRNGVTGEPILGSQALAGKYDPNSPIRVVTDQNGNYSFTGLPRGNYAVFEVRPGGYLDGITTPGSRGGVVINPYVQVSPLFIEALVVTPPTDAILRIALPAGESSVSNNFSVVQTTTFFIPNTPPPPPNNFAPPLDIEVPDQPHGVVPGQPLNLARPNAYTGSSALVGYTWHLSVVNAGTPRGPGAAEPLIKLTAARADELAWSAGMEESEWALMGNRRKGRGDAVRRSLFGMRGAIPVTGDFNGDGISDIGVFKAGQWFIDLNGNGVWDEGDLWAKLGYDGDKPVVGDWDGDGKDDIGIFGRAWAGDPRAIAREPGLPDSHNQHTDVHKNVPPPVHHAALGVRSLKVSSGGQLRADLIDHVFHYGTPRDIPLVGDWNGDGTDTIGVFHDGWWYKDVDGNGKWTGADSAVEFGQPGDIPVVGDFNGDGIDDLGVYRNGTFYLDTNGNGKLDAQDQVIEMGQAGDVPVVGDWDGDGTQEVGVYRDGEIVKGIRKS